MWEMISEVLTSNNALIVLAFLAFFCLVGWWLLKQGLLVVHADAVTMGAENKEREIIRQQCEWVKIHLDELEASIEKPEGYDEYRGKFIAERMYDEYVVMITQNHINTTSAYVQIKQDRIISLVNSLTILPEYKTPEFEEMLKKDTRKCLEMLVQIRKVYR